MDEPESVMLATMDDQIDAPAYSDDNVSSEEDEMDETVQEPRNNSAMLYMDELDRAGKLDVSHVEQYLQWGKFDVPAWSHHTLNFLATMYCGTGSSRRTAQAVLNVIHTLYGYSYCIPRQI